MFVCVRNSKIIELYIVNAFGTLGNQRAVGIDAIAGKELVKITSKKECDYIKKCDCFVKKRLSILLNVSESLATHAMFNK